MLEGFKIGLELGIFLLDVGMQMNEIINFLSQNIWIVVIAFLLISPWLISGIVACVSFLMIVIGPLLAILVGGGALAVLGVIKLYEWWEK